MLMSVASTAPSPLKSPISTTPGVLTLLNSEKCSMFWPWVLIKSDMVGVIRLLPALRTLNTRLASAPLPDVDPAPSMVSAKSAYPPVWLMVAVNDVV